jgi:hypothetical protein
MFRISYKKYKYHQKIYETSCKNYFARRRKAPRVRGLLTKENPVLT